MLENKLFEFAGVRQHIFWTDKKIEQWEKERPNETTTEQYNNWLKEKFDEYKRERRVKENDFRFYSRFINRNIINV